MKKTLFTKFCRERSPKFQIMTRILEEDGVKTVEKSALTEEACVHVNRMEELGHELSEVYADSGLRVCSCTRIRDGVVVFPYLTSFSLEQAISEAEHFQDMKAQYEFLYQILKKQKGLTEFIVTDEFQSVFKNPALPAHLLATPVSNMDMIAGNILKDADGNWCLVDYEWVFPFPIPIEFIFARSIFLQERACALPDEQQNELYAIAGITPGQIDLYYHMEIAFQEYAAGAEEMYSLGKVHKALHRQVWPLELFDPKQASFQVLLRQTEPERLEMGYENTVQKDAVITFPVSDAEPNAGMELLLTGQEGVIKIRALTGVRKGEIEFINFESNADLVNYDDYYFTKSPVLRFKNKGYTAIEISYQIYWSGNGVAGELVRLIRSEAEYRDKEAAALYKKMQAEMEIERLKQEKKALEDELAAMRQRKIVKAADKVMEFKRKVEPHRKEK